MTKLLTIGETAEWLGISQATTLKLAKDGTLPGARFGKSWRLSGQGIEKMLGGGGQSRGKKQSKSAMSAAAA